MKLNIKFMIILLLVSLIPLIIVGFIEYSINKNYIINNLKKKNIKGASNLMHNIDIIMYRFYEDMRAFNEGKVPVFEYNTEEDITTYLNGKKKKFGYSSLSYFDKNMIKIADTDGHGIGKKQKIVPYFENILAGKISTGSYIRFLKAAGETMFIYFAAPIRNRHGKLIGYISAKYNPLEIKDLIKIEFEKEFHTTLIDENRNIIFSNCDILKH